MRICMISYIAPYTIPYIDIYLKQIRKTDAQCDIVFWDRDGNCKNEKEGNITYCPYASTALQSDSKFKRYFQYIPATLHLRKFLKRNHYDRVIFLQTHAAIACSGILKKKYKNKYLVDIRDFTLENFKLFRTIEKKAIDHSYATVISSNGYKSFLPKHEYVIAHNYTPVDKAVVQQINSRYVRNNCINISFIGYVRFYDMAKKLLLLFKNDKRFHLSYIGTGADALASFCRENQIQNVTLHDKFSPDQTADFYRDANLINNLYGNHNPYLDYALSNKLYYAAQFNIPILVSKGTYSCQVAKENNLGISWDPDESGAVDKLYKQFCDFDREKMQICSKKFLNTVVEDNSKFSKMINEFLEG